MTITTDLDQWWVETCGYNGSNSAKAEFQNILNEIDEKLDVLQNMNAAGGFDKLPASWRTKALWAWQQLNTARDAIKADPDFMEGINWRP